MKGLFSSAISFLLLASFVAADEPQNKCGVDNKCNKFSPCCTYAGWCGKGALFCGIDCNDKGNYNNTQCLKKAACKSTVYKFNDPSRFAYSEKPNGKLEKYLGNYNKHDWILRGGNIEFKNGNLLLKSDKNVPAAQIEATRYLLYGKMTARMKSADSPGIVSSFITWSDVKDEIDWEWVGGNLKQAQSNYFWKGDKVSGNGGKHKLSTDSSVEFHDYTINWSPEGIQWGIDGEIVHTVKASERGGKLPNTPSRVMFSIWTTTKSEKGDKEWAGGDINYNTPQFTKNGYFDVEIESLTVECTGDPLSSDDDFKNYLNDQNGVDKEKKEKEKKEREEKKKRGEKVDDEEDDGNNGLTAPVANFGPDRPHAGGSTSDAVLAHALSYLFLGFVPVLLSLIN